MKAKRKYLWISVVIIALIIIYGIIQLIIYWQTPLNMEELKKKARDKVIYDLGWSMGVKKPDSLLNYYIGPILRSNDSILYNFEFYRIFTFEDTSRIYVSVDRKRFDYSEVEVGKDILFYFNYGPKGNINQILPEKYKHDTAFINKLHFSPQQEHIFDSLGFKNYKANQYRVLYFLKNGYFIWLETHHDGEKNTNYFQGIYEYEDNWKNNKDFSYIKFDLTVDMMLRVEKVDVKPICGTIVKVIVDDSAGVLILPVWKKY